MLDHDITPPNIASFLQGSAWSLPTARRAGDSSVSDCPGCSRAGILPDWGRCNGNDAAQLVDRRPGGGLAECTILVRSWRDSLHSGDGYRQFQPHHHEH
jgi:hypothetical protein